MQFLKKHYEKIILMVVLAGLLGAAIFLLLQVRSIQESTADEGQAETGKKAEKEPAERYTNLIFQIKNPVSLDLATHHVFNSHTWFIKSNPPSPEAIWIQGTNIGPAKLQVLKLAPLLWMVDAKAGIATERTNFSLIMLRQDDPRPAMRRPITKSVEIGRTNKLDDSFQAVLKSATGLNSTNTAQFVVDIFIAGRAPVTDYVIRPGFPFRMTNSYSADLIYPPNPVPPLKPDLRMNDTIVIEGEPYKILEIRETGITVESVKTQKRTTVPVSPARP